jgi:hypothetical protein
MDAAGIGFILGFGLLFGGAALYYLGERCILSKRNRDIERSTLLKRRLQPKTIILRTRKHWKMKMLLGKAPAILSSNPEIFVNSH